MTKPEWADHHGRGGHRVVRTIDSQWPIVHERGDRPLAAPRAACSTQLCTALLLCLLPTRLERNRAWPGSPQGQGESPVSSGSLAVNVLRILGIILRTPVPNAYDPSAAPGHNHSSPLFLSRLRRSMN